MPDLLTPQTIASAGPLVLDTLFKHFLSHKSLKARSNARGDDLMYDEAFVLMKTFLESATKYPVASLQKFSQVRTPAPPAIAIHHISIPYRSLALSAEYLIKAFGGEEMAYKIAGGSKWWQVRAGAGVEAEWIVMKKDYKEWEKGEKAADKERRKRSSVSDPKLASETEQEEEGAKGGIEDDGWRSEMDEMRCMLYIHGGAYYWGSINTHRYTIWRYARKMRGRCFAVNYRKAPQYPFPCAIQDCLAAYLYLTRPPPGAKHRPVKPEHMIIAGDSAGGGLVLALLQILRDTEGLELPAGAALISPWSDLTHSFPSILHNTSTDIVPPYSFIHKPSSLWPPPPPDLTDAVQSRIKSKLKEFTAHLRSNPDEDLRDDPAEADAHHNIPLMGRPAAMPEKLRSSQLGGKKKFSLNFGKADLHPTTHQMDSHHQPLPDGEATHNPSRANPAEAYTRLNPVSENQANSTTLAKCDYPVELNVQGEQVLIDTQIQLYATNAQLCYPLVSPVLGYLGGLCPLYICAGDNEVLRDEIIYLAHKAANPGKYPIRDDIRKMMPHYEGIEQRFGPTKVHLQVFDGTGHDLPLFSMCKSARGVFRAISTFARYVTPSASVMPTSTSRNGSVGGIFMSPFTGMSRRESTKSITKSPRTMSPALSPVDSVSPKERQGSIVTFSTPSRSSEGSTTTTLAPPLPSINSLNITDSLSPPQSPKTMSRPAIGRSMSEISAISQHAPNTPPSIPVAGTETPVQTASGDDAGPRWGQEDDQNNPAGPGEAGHAGIYRGPNAFKDNMIRERVDPHGKLRPLEPESELGAMTMPSDEIGMIKEGPAMRYLTGQYLWDKKYKHARKQVEKSREKNLKDARKIDRSKIVQDVKGRYESHKAKKAGADLDGNMTDGEDHGVRGDDDFSWSWGWALDGEVPPPSAIVSRRDTIEARKLALMADRLDSSKPSAIGGLSIWVALATFFSNVGEKEKAGEAVKQARDSRLSSNKERNRSNGSTSAEGSDESDGVIGTDGEEEGYGSHSGVATPETRMVSDDRIADMKTNTPKRRDTIHGRPTALD